MINGSLLNSTQFNKPTTPSIILLAISSEEVERRDQSFLKNPCIGLSFIEFISKLDNSLFGCQ